jgi:hypothetical protein
MKWLKRNLFYVCFFGYLFGGTLSYGHAYWKFKPCELHAGEAGFLGMISALIWPMYVSYTAFQPINYTCGEVKK